VAQSRPKIAKAWTEVGSSRPSSRLSAVSCRAANWKTMNQRFHSVPQVARAGSGRSRSRRGAELLEFTLAFIPMIAIISVLMNITWGIYAKATLQRAVRMGVRTGVTITGAQVPAGSSLTSIVKDIVQQNSMGVLAGAPKRQMIKVHYFKPPGSGTTDPVTEVSGQSDGNAAGNIMQVAVEGYSVVPIIPLIFGFGTSNTHNPLAFSVYSADRIEPSRDRPTIGAAP
jgi:Flp pilus assembly protein TadG